MSFHRENVVWQSRDGSWNIGFFDVVWTGADPEWDVEYDYKTFQWASIGHADDCEAEDAWKGSNPGMSVIMGYENNEEQCDAYDAMAQEYLAHPVPWGGYSVR